jgi:hypothetical protein
MRLVDRERGVELFLIDEYGPDAAERVRDADAVSGA